MRMRLTALSLALIECAALWFVAGHPLFGAVGGVLAIACCLAPWRLQPSRGQAMLFAGLAAVLALVPHLLGVYGPRLILVPTVLPVLFLFDTALLVQAGLFLHRPAMRAGLAHPSQFLFLGFVVMAGAGLTQARQTEQLYYGLLSIAFVAAALGLVSRDQLQLPGPQPAPRLLRITSALLFLGAVCIAWPISQLLARHGNELDRVFAQLFVQAPVSSQGFSRTATLSSITSLRLGEEKIVLRVESDTEPGYLRACVYERFENGRWYGANPGATITGVALPGPAREGGRRHFSLREGNPGDPAFHIWQEPHVWDSLFLPADAVAIVAAAQGVQVDPHGAVPPQELDVRQPITVYRAPPPEPSAHDTANLLRVPETLDPRVHALAASLRAGVSTPREIAAAVESYFHSHYSYELGVQVPEGMDPINYFLLERPPAHCEFFAAGALMLLRLAGVPARYVTGVVAAEQNPFDGTWIARNRDAHAWVEAFDPATGWFLVEATPGSGVPQGVRHAWWRYARECLAHLWRQARAFLATAWMRDTFSLTFVSMVTAAVAWVLLASALLRFLARQWRRRKAHRMLPKAMRDLHRALHLQDRKLQHAGFRRAGTETLHQFAARIEEQREDLAQEAAWYREYAVKRYAARK